MNVPSHSAQDQHPATGSKVIQFQVIDRMLYILLDDGTLWKRAAVLEQAAEAKSPWHKLATVGAE